MPTYIVPTFAAELSSLNGSLTTGQANSQLEALEKEVQYLVFSSLYVNICMSGLHLRGGGRKGGGGALASP